MNSPKVATYDLQPEMSAYEVTDRLLEKLQSNPYDVIILNFANCDMVGHTGVFEAAVKAVEAVDTCVGKLVDRVTELGGVTMVTADHGNADKMIAEDGGPFTAHTTNPVPFCVVGYPCTLRETGCLADIAESHECTTTKRNDRKLADFINITQLLCKEKTTNLVTKIENIEKKTLKREFSLFEVFSLFFLFFILSTFYFLFGN